MRFKGLILFILLSLTTLPLFAKELSILGRTTNHNCVYYTSKSVDLRIIYKNVDLPWGTTVEIEFGLEESDYSYGEAKVSSWKDRKMSKLRAVDKFVWQIDIKEIIAERSQPKSYTGLDFVLKITIPRTPPFYEKGNNSPMGYYHVPFADENYPHQGCYPANVIDYQKFYFYDVKK